MATMLEDMAEIAKKNLAKHGHLVAVFMLIKGEEFVVPPSPMARLGRICAGHGMDNFNLEDTKTRDHLLIGGLARAYGADRVILIIDAAFRSIQNPEDFKYDETEAPLSYPKSMRTECIIVYEVLLPSGQDNTITVPYKGGEGKPVEFIQWEEKIAKALKEGGKYQSRFTELILEGYKKAGAIL